MPETTTTAVVTGAARGIGRETARQLGALGWRVVLGVRDPERADEARRDVESAGGEAIVFELDVASDDSVAAFAEAAAERVGRVDVLINNAGINFDYQVPSIEADIDLVIQTMNTNTWGAYRVTRALLPLLQAPDQPRLIMVSSEAGSFGATDGLASRGATLLAYCVSKAALNALTVKLAEALKADGVRVNAVCPGFTATAPGTEAWGARPVEEGAASVVRAATGAAAGADRDLHARWGNAALVARRRPPLPPTRAGDRPRTGVLNRTARGCARQSTALGTTGRQGCGCLPLR